MKIKFANGELLIYVNGSGHSKKKIKLLYEKWLAETTQSFVDNKIKLHSEEWE
jgi:hypothetical protein